MTYIVSFKTKGDYARLYYEHTVRFEHASVAHEYAQWVYLNISVVDVEVSIKQAGHTVLDTRYSTTLETKALLY